MKRRQVAIIQAAYRNLAPTTAMPAAASQYPAMFVLMMWEVWPEDRPDLLLMIDLDDPHYPTLPEAIRIVTIEYVERVSLGV